TVLLSATITGVFPSAVVGALVGAPSSRNHLELEPLM
ncbi:hypothetical protein A2U01_0091338, partial [Trifolium medium]|nr:hypothetical protein [Trifolium medium]